MKALMITGKEKLELKDIPIPEISKNQVLVKVSYSGICGSDLPRYFEGGVHSFPQILGHEFSGVVDKVGSNVRKLESGDRVAVAPLVPCDECKFCKKGEPALCTNYSFIGSREPGAMAEYVAVPAENCVIIPESLSLKEAALIEPLTVAIHSIDRVKLNSGDRVIVYGAGTIGLLTILTLATKGVQEIIAVDINDKKLTVAKECGADLTINPNKKDLDDYFSENKHPTVVYETAGSSITQIQSLKYVEKLGKIVYVGTSTRDINLPSKVFERILRGELDITGAWMSYSAPFPGYEWEAGIKLMESGKIDVQPLISGIYSLEDKEKPFEDMIEENTGKVKLLYKIN